MINSIKMSMKIDRVYSINSFIYLLRKLPVLCDLFTDDIYNSKFLKSIFGLIVSLINIGKYILFKFFYFYLIYLLASSISNNIWESFIHIYFMLTILGLFINNKLLLASTKKYFSIILFNMDAKKFMWSSICSDVVVSMIFNSLFLGIIAYMYNGSLLLVCLLVLITMCARIVGESFSLAFYKKYKYVFIDNLKLYFLVVGIFIGLSLIPFYNIFINNYIILGSLISLVILSVFSLRYLHKVDNYKAIFKILNTERRVMNLEESKAYSRQAMVEVKNKDKIIDERKLKNKKGYDLFNTIFFERHKEILMRSIKKYSYILIVIYIGCCYVVINNNEFSLMVNNFLHNNLAWFILIMYFINRGAIITQAMFFNCDHAMLTYNFYREPKVILGLFKKRLLTVSLVNLMPALVIGVGNIVLLYLTGGSSLTNYISSLIFVLSLSIFFSVHYLVCYYLLQPYNSKMQVRSFSYSLVSIVTYFVCFTIFDLVIPSLLFSILGIIFSIIYIVLSLILVHKFAPSTFRIK